jgi:transcriptional regulator with XRE-family HTH domain
MEKTFRRMTTRPSARHAYVEAEVVTGLAHQIRVIRHQRGWSQKELAKHLGTTQAAVSRLEDPTYGRVSLQTLFALSRVFDAGLQVRFVSLVRMLQDTFRPRLDRLQVEPFEAESSRVGFYSAASTTGAVVTTWSGENLAPVSLATPVQQVVSTRSITPQLGGIRLWNQVIRSQTIPLPSTSKASESLEVIYG